MKEIKEIFFFGDCHAQPNFCHFCHFCGTKETNKTMTGRGKKIDGEEKKIPTAGIFYSQAGNVLFPRWE